MNRLEFIYIGALVSVLLIGWIAGTYYGQKMALKNTKIAVKVTAGKSKAASKDAAAL